jgi:hypothetical protein
MFDGLEIVPKEKMEFVHANMLPSYGLDQLIPV